MVHFSENNNLKTKLNYIYTVIERILFLNDSLWTICDVLRDLLPFVQFKHRKKHPWETCNFTKGNTFPWVIFTFFKLYKSCQILQGVTYQ